MNAAISLVSLHLAGEAENALVDALTAYGGLVAWSVFLKHLAS